MEWNTDTGLNIRMAVALAMVTVLPVAFIYAFVFAINTVGLDLLAWADGRPYRGKVYGDVLAIDHSGSRRWRVEEIPREGVTRNVFFGVTADDNGVYAMTGNSLVGIDPDDGHVSWRVSYDSEPDRHAGWEVSSNSGLDELLITEQSIIVVVEGTIVCYHPNPD